MKLFTLMLTLLLLTVGMAVADGEKTGHEGHQHEGAQMMSEGEMPEMGPPEELKELSFMVGDWKVEGKMRMDPTSEEWTPYTATCSYEWFADGAALMSTFKGEMFGMPMVGHSIENYDRETGQWQVTWIDNMMARQSNYTGGMEGDKMVITGQDLMEGQVFGTRITVFNMSEKSFDWKMEHSMDDGKTWATFMQATYTKKM